MKLTIELRPASIADEPFLLQLRKSTMTEHLQKAGVATDDGTHFERIRANFEDARVVRAGDEDVGLLKISREVSKWHVHQLQISPNCQGRGIGEAVLRLVLAEAKEANVAVSLSVMHRNPARRLYERLGFKYAGETPSDVKLLWRPQTAM
jgi:ribosomal protein S18 acetylase RimI-like enzyme